MLQRWRPAAAAAVAIVALVATVWWTVDRFLLDRRPIVVGILH